MPGWADAKIKQVILETEAVEKCGAGQALTGGSQSAEMQGAGYLGMRNKKSGSACAGSYEVPMGALGRASG